MISHTIVHIHYTIHRTPCTIHHTSIDDDGNAQTLSALDYVMIVVGALTIIVGAAYLTHKVFGKVRRGLMFVYVCMNMWFIPSTLYLHTHNLLFSYPSPNTPLAHHHSALTHTDPSPILTIPPPIPYLPIPLFRRSADT
ncbi:hypothetical protein EON63_11775 [archaeon]|nr:MAG: hypothetical protein EON63_11775 [archaeon]